MYCTWYLVWVSINEYRVNIREDNGLTGFDLGGARC